MLHRYFIIPLCATVDGLFLLTQSDHIPHSHFQSPEVELLLTYCISKSDDWLMNLIKCQYTFFLQFSIKKKKKKKTLISPVMSHTMIIIHHEAYSVWSLLMAMNNKYLIIIKQDI